MAADESTVAVSKNGVAIRLPEERWLHLIAEHGELHGLRREVIQAVAEPERILAGSDGECWRYALKMTTRFWSPLTGKWPMMVSLSPLF